MKQYVAVLIASLAFLAASQVTTAKAQSPPSTTTYLSLLRDGFEVKSVVLIFNDAQKSTPMGTVVTLQKGGVTSRCWITYASYGNSDTREPGGLCY